MKKIKILLAAALLFMVTAYAQREQVREAIQKDQYEKHGKQYEDMVRNMLGGMSNVTTSPQYVFPMSITQHIVTYKNGAVKNETDIKYYLNGEKKIFGMDGSQMGDNKKNKNTNMITVYDNENSAMLMFNITDKSLFAMNLDAFKGMAGKQVENQKKDAKKPAGNDVKCGKTGKTKTIMGYPCYEYACTTEGKKSRSVFWISTDPKLADMNMMGLGSSAGYGKNIGMPGAILEMDTYNDDGQLSTSMTVKEVNKTEDLKLVTADFKQQQMPGF